VRAGVAVCLVLAILAASGPAAAGERTRPASGLVARAQRVARIYRLSLRDTVRHGHKLPQDHRSFALVITALGGAIALDRPILAPVVTLACLALTAEGASTLGWRDGRLDRKNGLFGAPFRLATRLGVGIAVGAGLPPMRSAPGFRP